MRVVVWILVGLGTLGLIAIVALVLVGRSLTEKAETVQKFAANATQADCAEEVVRRAKDCEDFGVSCIMDLSIFAPGCMSGAKPSEGEEFCASVPASEDEQEIVAWSESFCPPRELDENRCAFIAGMLSAACGSAKPTT
jgi:hypothetical protein